ncbi:MAG TPA: energy transducer TonB [Pyrinomonadaceae bacterium]|nr:energy transducer TonB [Pyrinomonadaceae bacterium]
MSKRVRTVACGALLVIGIAFATVSASPDWQSYKLAEKNLSVRFPHLPIRFNSVEACVEKETVHYLAYANDRVYEIRVIQRLPRVSALCRSTKQLDERLFEERIALLKSESGEHAIFADLLLERSVDRFVYSMKAVWVVNDLRNKRWIELVVHKRSDISPDDDEFVRSLRIGNRVGGLTVKEWATQVGGSKEPLSVAKEDNAVRHNSEANSLKNVVSTNAQDPLLIIAKPRAVYTEVARKEGVQGTIRLNVHFLPNGAIGEIDVIEGLPFGLTEAAIAAARRMVFLPAREGEKNIAVVETVEYKFQMY